MRVGSGLKDISRMKKIFALFIIILIVVSTATLVVHYSLLGENKETKPFYVGVTYCGESFEEAKQLIDKVKNYTNLFVLQSGLLQLAPSAINEIGDYAVSSGMYFIVYFGNQNQAQLEFWLKTAKGRWGERFLGVYYGDEPAGKMLDAYLQLQDNTTNSPIPMEIVITNGTTNTSIIEGARRINATTSTSIIKGPGMISMTRPDGTNVKYFADGRITVRNNGTIIEYERNGEIRMYVPPDDMEVPVDPSQVESYEDLWNSHPFPTHEAITNFFISDHQGKLGYLHNNSITAFTSDYALYWFNYKAGYDVVLAQFGWNHTLVQDIALVRGAAKLQNKTWGAIITWKYNNPPYLDSGEAIYDQMLMAYEAGAEYVVIFNYADDMDGTYGTLQDEHFAALERFWTEVVQSSAVKQGSIEAEAVLVLPENYGWGMRNIEDTIWGLWEPDEKSKQIWEISRNLIEQYGLGLDMVYDDPEFPVEGKYPQIFYWNHTG